MVQYEVSFNVVSQPRPIHITVVCTIGARSSHNCHLLT